MPFILDVGRFPYKEHPDDCSDYPDGCTHRESRDNYSEHSFSFGYRQLTTGLLNIQNGRAIISDMNKQLEFLAIGDITTDAFIKISDAWIETDNPKKEHELCMRFAEKVPYESLTEIPAVGNSANAAVCAARLGPAAGPVSKNGADWKGQKLF